jgi:hypothetical protein
LDTINAIVNAAHLPNQPLAPSHVNPANAKGPNTTDTRIRALRTRSENQTIRAEEIARPAKKMVMMAPAPGAVKVRPPNPAASRAMRAPMSAMVWPVAWTMPIEIWSVASRSRPVRVRTRKLPRIDFARPVMARFNAAGSRRTRPVMSCRVKKISMRKIATPNTRA